MLLTVPSLTARAVGRQIIRKFLSQNGKVCRKNTTIKALFLHMLCATGGNADNSNEISPAGPPCIVVGTVVERDRTSDIRVCRARSRSSLVFSSKTHKINIRFHDSEITNSETHFLLKYEGTSVLSIVELKFTNTFFKVERLYLYGKWIHLRSQFVKVCWPNKITSIPNTYKEIYTLHQADFFVWIAGNMLGY